YFAIGALIVISYAYITMMVEIPFEFFYAIVFGCVSGVIVGLMTEYYTGGEPVERVARASQSGAATNLIYGLSVGMESTVAPIIALSLAVLGAYTFGGALCGVALSAVAMLATVGITM